MKNNAEQAEVSPKDSTSSIRVLYVTSQWPTEDKPHFAPFVKREVEALRAAGMLVDVYHYIGEWNPVKYVKAIQGFRLQLKKHSYDVVHAFFGQCGLVAISQRSIPVVVSFGGSDLIGWENAGGREPLASKFLTAVSRFVARHADQVTIQDINMVPYLPKKKLSYTAIPTGINLDVFRPMDQHQAREQLNLPADKKLVLFAADPKRILKRFDLAQTAVEIVKQRLSVDLIITANIPHEHMPIYFNACDVLVLTSQHEGSPNVVKEALACNLPVVSVDVGDVRDRFGESPDCVVCKTDIPEDIAKGLLDILERPTRGDTRHMVQNLRSDNITKQIITIYEKAINP